MRITSNFTYSKPTFKGINDAINRIANQYSKPNLNKDTFEFSQGEQTIIIQHYHEAEKNTDTISKSLKNGMPTLDKASVTTNGVISGATTGGAIEGTKSVIKKVKTARQNNIDENSLSGNAPSEDASDLQKAQVVSSDNINEIKPIAIEENPMQDVAEPIITPEIIITEEIEPFGDIEPIDAGEIFD